MRMHQRIIFYTNDVNMFIFKFNLLSLVSLKNMVEFGKLDLAFNGSYVVINGNVVVIRQHLTFKWVKS